ncbi:MAG: site-specific DNA-methyltransferase [Lentisphaeria bacterium]|nr:MAG: site-specific DNA-methyltransferase [Lentisphaeria bacterium]
MFELTGRRYVFERHAFSYSQWEFPSEEQFLAAATFLPLGDHGDALLSYQKAREAYEALRVKYEHIRRFHQAKKRNYTDFWQYRTIKPGDPERIHPCQKPIDMLCDIIETSTRPGALVLDCFAGSGQTAVAARKTDRRCILIERDPEYCRAIARRLSK